MKYNGMFKVDFKEARENAGLDIAVVEKIAKGVGRNIDLQGIESNKVKPSETDISLLMSIYGQTKDNGEMKF